MTGATVGKVATCGYDNMLLNQRVGLIRAKKEDVLQNYLRNLLLNEKFYSYCQLMAGGGAQGNISPSQIQKYEIPLPPLEVQQGIVKQLDSYQKIIDGAKQVITHYEPEIRIDPSWERVELGEVCKKITDGSHFSPSTVDKGYPYITVKDIVHDEIIFAECRFINEDDYYKLVKNGCKPQKNDILFSKDGTVGKVTLIDYDRDFVVLSSLAIVRPNIKRITPQFLKYILKTDYFFDKAIENKTGVAIRRIVLKTLKTIKIPLPPLETQNQIVARIEEEQKLVSANKKLVKTFEQKIKEKIDEVWGERYLP